MSKGTRRGARFEECRRLRKVFFVKLKLRILLYDDLLLHNKKPTTLDKKIKKLTDES